MKISTLYKRAYKFIENKMPFVMDPMGNIYTNIDSNSLKYTSYKDNLYYGFVNIANIAKKRGKYIVGEYSPEGNYYFHAAI